MFTSRILMPICIVVMLIAACQPTSDTMITPNAPVTVNLPPGATRRVYSFNANPASPTTLRFDSTIPGTPFTAEILDNSGQVVAVISGGAMQTASLTLGPASGLYQVALSSTNPDAQGSVRVSIVDPLDVADVTSLPSAGGSASTNAQSTAPEACTVTVIHPGGVNVRTAPNLDSTVLGVMSPGSSLPADARSSGGWYRVYNGSQGGWVSGDVVSVSGMCANLPLQMIPPNTSASAESGTFMTTSNTGLAPYDVESYYFSAISDQGGQFSESVSYPDGDGTDRLLLAISGLSPGVNDARPFSVTMECSGAGAELLRWGTVDNPTFGCGTSVNVTFSSTFDRLSLLVALPGSTSQNGIQQSYVNYTLRAAPIAPEDAPILGMGVDRDGGGQIRDMLSYPGGDRTDTVQIGVVNFTPQAPNNYRELRLTLECSGTGAGYVLWGLSGGQAQPCGTAINVAFTHEQYLQSVMIMLSENSPQSYVSYVLRAVPVAPADSDQFMFGIDREAGGQFNETLSLPDGDRSDTLLVLVNNLTQNSPHNFRNVLFTLFCTGTGIEQLRWGTPNDVNSGCNMSITVPFLFGQSGQNIIVRLPDDGTQSYVHYTLVATPLV